MNITATGAPAVQGAGFGRPSGPPPAPKMDGTAKLLGMTADELQQAQRSGTKLTDLAASKGVSKDDLVAAVASDMKANKPEGAPELDATQLTQMATNIADGVRPSGPPPQGGRQGGGEDRAPLNLSQVASALGMDTDTLLAKLSSGGALGSPTGYGQTAASTFGSGLRLDVSA